MKNPILVLDFDGVLHSYASGWLGADVIPDPPVPGMAEFLAAATRVFRVAVFSSRSGQSGGIAAMQAWLSTWLVSDPLCDPAERDRICAAIEWPVTKPAAFLTLDDRAMTFTGEWPAVETLLAFRPWYR